MLNCISSGAISPYLVAQRVHRGTYDPERLEILFLVVQRLNFGQGVVGFVCAKDQQYRCEAVGTRWRSSRKDCACPPSHRRTLDIVLYDFGRMANIFAESRYSGVARAGGNGYAPPRACASFLAHSRRVTTLRRQCSLVVFHRGDAGGVMKC